MGQSSPSEHYLTLGEMVSRLPTGMSISDYTEGIYYRSIQEKSQDVVTIHDYLWRWDTDWSGAARIRCAEAGDSTLVAEVQTPQ